MASATSKPAPQQRASGACTWLQEAAPCCLTVTQITCRHCLPLADAHPLAPVRIQARYICARDACIGGSAALRGAVRTQDEGVHKVRRLLQAARIRRVLGGLYLHLPHDGAR